MQMKGFILYASAPYVQAGAGAQLHKNRISTLKTNKKKDMQCYVIIETVGFDSSLHGFFFFPPKESFYFVKKKEKKKSKRM